MPNAIPSPTRRKRHIFAALLTALAALALAAPASAVAPEFLWQTPADSVTPGSGAGQLNNPRGMVADPDTGHLYVAELANSRISEFTAWGTFVKAWGWDVAPEGAPGDTPSDQFETCTTICQAGSEGEGPGQVKWPFGVTLDTAGDLYVHDLLNNRVLKFSPSGQFLLVFGGQVNKTAAQEREAQEANSEPVTVTPQEENLCTATSGDVCGAGVSGTAEGYFSTGLGGNYLTFNPQTGTLFAGDKDRIQEFGTDGTFKDKIDFEGPGELEAFDGRSVQALAADPASGDLYLAFASSAPTIESVRRLDAATGALLDELEVPYPVALATDIEGNVYAVLERFGDSSSGTLDTKEEVLGFDPIGDPIEGMELGDGIAMPPSLGIAINGLATNVSGPGSEEPGNLYVDYFTDFDPQASNINAYGPPPIAFEDPPLLAPEITDQYATAAGTKEAVVQAKINPQFWDDATYYVQYGTEQCIEGGWDAPCVSEEPAAPGKPLIKQSVRQAITTAGILLHGLQPETTYRYRFAARSSGSGGEDVFGVGGTLAEDGAEATFTTFALPDPAATDCPNQAFRIGPGANLPDCRAYEMVSPLEKGSGDIYSRPGLRYSHHQSAAGGERFTYSSATPFGGVKGAPNVSQYMAVREPGIGWRSEAISPFRGRSLDLEGIVFAFELEYKLFSADLCDAWLRTAYEPPLAAGAVPGHLNLYRRENCEPGLGEYAALTTVAPPAAPPGSYTGLEVQGISADASKALIGAQDSLTPDAPAQPASCATIQDRCKFQLYLHSTGEPLRFLCYLPNDKPINPAVQACYAGTESRKGTIGEGDTGSMQNALSADGSRVYFTAATGETTALGGGRIYLRLVEEEKTLQVSQEISGEDAVFRGAADDGSAALFEFAAGTALAGNLYHFDAAEENSEPIAEDALGVLGTSQDLSHVYFASRQALPGENSAGDEAAPGEPNLYLWVEGSGARFIGTLASADLHKQGSALADEAFNRLARVTEDGLHAAFMSATPLSGFDNTDASTGAAAAEVFLYDAQAEELRCVSCNPSGIRPTGRPLIDSENGEKVPGIWIVAQIPGQEHSNYASRVLAEDGSRLFFESYEALVPRDTNGQQDVYEWEEAGEGSCKESDAAFHEQAGGCVELISSGQSPQASYFRDASSGGNDVFFTTLSSLVPQDYGLIDVYDARVGGGFPQPTKVPGCEGEACQGPVVAPDDPTPGSSSFEGSGNVSEPPRPTKCAKGRRAVRKAGRTRCVKKPRKAKRAKRANTKRANTTRRAAR